MSILEIQLIETAIIIVLYILLYYLIKNIINNSLKNIHLQRARRKIIIKASQLITTLTAFLFLAAVWGVDQSEIMVFAGTVLTALGIAFFAQWSLLANITSGIILFFNHPLKIGDRIKVLDKDFPFEGEISDLTYFFLHIKTTSGEVITIPNTLLLQKSIAVIENSEITEKSEKSI